MYLVVEEGCIVLFVVATWAPSFLNGCPTFRVTLSKIWFENGILHYALPYPFGRFILIDYENTLTSSIQFLRNVCQFGIPQPVSFFIQCYSILENTQQSTVTTDLIPIQWSNSLENWWNIITHLPMYTPKFDPFHYLQHKAQYWPKRSRAIKRNISYFKQ